MKICRTVSFFEYVFGFVRHSWEITKLDSTVLNRLCFCMHVSIQVDLVRICKWNWPKKIFPFASNWVKLPIFWQTNVFIPDCTLACTCNPHSLTEIHSTHDGVFTVFALHINEFFPYPLLPASRSDLSLNLTLKVWSSGRTSHRPRCQFCH